MIAERFHYAVTAEVVLSTNDINTLRREALERSSVLGPSLAKKVDVLLRTKFRPGPDRFDRGPDTHHGRIDMSEALTLAGAVKDYADEGYENPMYDKFMKLAATLDKEYRRVNSLIGI